MNKDSYYDSLIEELDDLTYCWQLGIYTVPEKAYVSFEFYDAKCIQCDNANYCMLLKEKSNARNC